MLQLSRILWRFSVSPLHVSAWKDDDDDGDDGDDDDDDEDDGHGSASNVGIQADAISDRKDDEEDYSDHNGSD
jgi:hypothetical protein